MLEQFQRKKSTMITLFCGLLLEYKTITQAFRNVPGHMECFWSINVLLSIHSVFLPAARWPVPGNARHDAPAKMVASVGAKGSAPVPLDGRYVLESDLERTLTFMLPTEAARLWISSCVSRFPAGSEIWTSCLFFFTLTYLQAHFEATCHFWKHADGFPWMWQIDDEVSLFLEGDSWEKSAILIPSESEVTDYFLHQSVCRCLSPGFPATHLHLLGISSCFLCCSAGASLHRAMLRRTVWTKLFWGVCLPQQGQMWPWNWTVSVRQRFHW